MSSDPRSKAVQAALQRQQHSSIAGPAAIPPTSSTITHTIISPTSPTSPSSPISTSTDPLRSLIIFVVGAPGAGKSTQCAALASNLSFHHIIFDDFLRQTIKYADLKLSATKKKSTSTPLASSRRPLASFTPSSLSSTHLTTLLRHSQSRQSIPSSIRARILYSAMQHLSAAAPLFRFLVDGYLDSEDDWNEWAALVKKRAAERDEKRGGGGGGGKGGSSSIGFLPPIIIRLVCSESVGQLRWRMVLRGMEKGDSHPSSPISPSSLPSSAEVKTRSMKYSLRTRPMIYRLGMVSAERRRRLAEKGDRDTRSEEVEVETDEEEDDDDDDDDPDRLAVIDGMIVKRVDGEASIDAVYHDMEVLVREIIAHTGEEDWTRITGYETGDDEDQETDHLHISSDASTTTSTPALTIRPAPPTPIPALTAPPISTPAPITSSTLEPPAAEEPVSDSPREINWQEDPDIDEETAAEELDRLQRTQRMLALIDEEERKWLEEQSREEEREKRKIEEEIRRIREREELVEAESGHIRTRRDDRFITFISTTVAVSMVGGVKEGDGQVWVEVYRGFERPESGGEVRWLSVNRTAKLPVTSLSMAFPRVIVNTWRLSGNERERPIMFRLFHSPLPSSHSSSSSSPAKPPPPPTLLGESRTMLQHLLVPPEEKGLTLTLRKTTTAQPIGYLLVSPASLHTLLKPNKIIPPHRLHTVMADRVIIPATIPLTPSNKAEPHGASPETSLAGAGVSAGDAKGKGAEKSEEKEREKGKERKDRDKDGDRDRGDRHKREKERGEKERKRRGSDPDVKGDRKSMEPKEEEEMARLLREMDQQIGGSRINRRHSFNASATSGPSAPSTPPAKPAEESKTRERPLSLVEQARAVLGRLSITSAPPVSGAVRVAGKKESKLERQRRELWEERRKRKREEAKELQKRAASRERRRKELARIKRRAQVQKVSALTVDCALSNLPKRGIFTEPKFYLQVYRKRDKVKERERALKAQRAALKASSTSSSPSTTASLHATSVKLADEFPPESRNFCIHSSHRHLVKPSLFSLAYSSPVQTGLSPSFSPFLLPLDDQPLLFVVVSSSCSHRHDVTNERLKEHEGKDKIIGMVRLSVEDVVKMAIIQQREWDVDVYAMVQKEAEKERRREAKIAEAERRRARGEEVHEQWEEDEDRVEELSERAAADKHRVSVLLKEPAVIEKEREARKAKREAKKRAKSALSGAAPIPVTGAGGGEESSDEDDSDEEGDDAPAVVGKDVPMLSFFSLAFFTTRPVQREEMGLKDYTGEVRRESGSKLGLTAGTGTAGLRYAPVVSSSVSITSNHRK